jgi:hypothetical protein
VASVPECGDQDGDGNADVLIGAPYDETAGYYPGGVYLFTGPVTGRLEAPEADFVTVNVEVTVVLPLIVSALAESHADVIAKREPPALSFEGIESPAARSGSDGLPAKR